MKSIIFSSSLLAALASAAPLVSQGTVNIKLELDAQALSATVFSVPFGVLSDVSNSVSPGFEVSVNGANGVSIPTQSIVCQAFKDAAGTLLLRNSFDETLPGTKISNTADAVQIGSIFCSDAAGVQAQIGRSAPPTPPTAAKGIARVQLNFESEGAAQGDVPLDNSIVPIRGNFATGTASSAFIVDAEGVSKDQVSCQAWEDEQATVKLGKPFSGSEEEFFSNDGTPVPIGSLKCKVI